MSLLRRFCNTSVISAHIPTLCNDRGKDKDKFYAEILATFLSRGGIFTIGGGNREAGIVGYDITTMKLMSGKMN